MVIIDLVCSCKIELPMYGALIFQPSCMCPEKHDASTVIRNTRIARIARIGELDFDDDFEEVTLTGFETFH